MNNPSLDTGIRAVPIEATDQFGNQIHYKTCSHCGGVNNLRRIRLEDNDGTFLGYGGICGFCRHARTGHKKFFKGCSRCDPTATFQSEA